MGCNSLNMIENPWKKISSKIVYSNPWITVREDEVIRPDGKAGIYGVVETRVATGVVAIDNNHNIFLVGQYRYPTDCYSWEIIEGGAEEGEEAILAAKRELLEEAGLVANEWIQLGPEVQLSNCHSSEIGYLFLARDLTQQKNSPDDTEVLELKSIPFQEAYDMLSSGQISDCISIVGIERAKRYLKL